LKAIQIKEDSNPVYFRQLCNALVMVYQTASILLLIIKQFNKLLLDAFNGFIINKALVSFGNSQHIKSFLFVPSKTDFYYNKECTYNIIKGGLEKK